MCHPKTGYCSCKENISGKQCKDCTEGRFHFPDCTRNKMDDNTFIHYLKNSMDCLVGKPHGQNDTYYTLVINCALQNTDQKLTDDCRAKAENCLKNKVFEEATIEVLKNLSMKHKESLQKFYEMPISLFEKEPKMIALIQQCTMKFGVDQQWFWNPQISNACKGFNNLLK